MTFYTWNYMLFSSQTRKKRNVHPNREMFLTNVIQQNETCKF